MKFTKKYLMIGPTGVGKTEISRRLSKLAEAPFVKVEATRFTEVGYVGRDVEQIVRDLIENCYWYGKSKKWEKEVHAQAQKSAEEKVLDALVGKKASLATRESFRKRLRNGDLDDNEIEIAVSDTGSNNTSFEIPGMPGANVGMINIGEMIGKSMGNKEKKKKMTVKESHEILINDESDKLIEQDKIIKAAKLSTENNGIEQEIDATQIFNRRNTTVSDYPLNDYALGMLSEEIGNHVEKTGSLPTDRRITIEERNDALMVNSCHGSKINETLGHLILAMASTKSGHWGRLIVEPTRIGLQASQVKAEDIVGWLKNTPPEALEGILSVTLPNSRQVRWRFAQVAKTFGILKTWNRPS